MVTIDPENDKELALMIQLVTSAFHKYDEDGSGELSHDEVKLLFNDICKFKDVPAPNDKDVGAILVRLDDNGDQLLQLEELLNNMDEFVTMIAMPAKSRIEQLLREGFLKYDKKSCGFLNRKNLKRLFDKICWDVCVENFSEEQIDEVLVLCNGEEVEIDHGNEVPTS
jgi:Ca2+-binding EF-hand superfamily protein